MNTIEQLIATGEARGLEKGLEQGRYEGLEQGRYEGLEQGLEKGLEKGLEQVAINMLGEDYTLENISSVTGLELAVVYKLQAQLKKLN